MSPVVEQRALETLTFLQLPDPQLILRSLSVEVVPGTEMLSLKITAASKAVAQASVNTIAIEFIRYYDEFLQAQGPDGKPYRPTLKIVNLDTARTAPPRLIFGFYPNRIRIPAGTGAAGMLLGFLIGILVGKRSITKRAL